MSGLHCIMLRDAERGGCNENFGPPAKIGPPGLILAAKSGPYLPISVPPTKYKHATNSAG